MVLGLSVHAFTLLHVAISLIAIGAGLAFFIALTRGHWLGIVNAVFLVFTILTSVTGFMFPPKPIGPPHIFGAVSLVLLAVALYAVYAAKLSGGWRRVYLATTLIAQWLNMVVLVVQSYQKIPALHSLAPTGTEPAVLLSQTLVLIMVAAAGWTTLRRRA